MAYLVHRLEQCLRCWEDYCFLGNVSFHSLRSRGHAPPFPLDGAFIYAPHFRKFLLRAHHEKFDLNRFWGLSENQKVISAQLGALTTIPWELYNWTLHSRRVYHLTAELQELLRHTSLQGIRWGDIQFPFNSFAVTLSRPLVDQGKRYDCILQSLEEFQGNEITFLRLLSTDLKRYPAVREHDRVKILKVLRERRWDRLTKILARRIAAVKSIPWFAMSLPHSKTSDCSVYAISADEKLVFEGYISADTDALLKGILNIVVGLALYLKTLPAETPHRSEWRQAPKMSGHDTNVITDEAEVCVVDSCYTLSRGERVMLGLAGDRHERAHYELSWHFREGHWRRPPGLGQDPTAEKTVHVRPTIVRRDRMPESGLPRGIEKEI